STSLRCIWKVWFTRSRLRAKYLSTSDGPRYLPAIAFLPGTVHSTSGDSNFRSSESSPPAWKAFLAACKSANSRTAAAPAVVRDSRGPVLAATRQCRCAASIVDPDAALCPIQQTSFVQHHQVMTDSGLG